MSRIDTLERAHKKYKSGSLGPATFLRIYVFSGRSLGDIYPQFHVAVRYRIVVNGFARMRDTLEKLCPDSLEP